MSSFRHKRNHHQGQAAGGSGRTTVSPRDVKTTSSSPTFPASCCPPSPEDLGRRDVSPSLPEIAVHKNVGSSNSSGERVVYMTDLSNFKYAVHEIGDPFRGSSQNLLWADNLQNYMLEQLGQPSRDTLARIQSDDQSHLKLQGAFSYPIKETRDELIRIFLDYSYPACPIFIISDLMALYETERLSPLILNAIFLMATFHCPDLCIRSMGFASRYLASLTFYRRAKALFDAGYEVDGISTIQAAILMSHWIDGPMEQKDVWHWLGIASGLAQSLGMNRTLAPPFPLEMCLAIVLTPSCSKSYLILPPLYQKIWRRIWWVLYVSRRDIFRRFLPTHTFCRSMTCITRPPMVAYRTFIPTSAKSSRFLRTISRTMTGICLIRPT